MWRPLRLQHDPAGNGGVVDVLVDVDPTATVGELADALAASVGAPAGCTVAARWPDDLRDTPPRRDAPLMTHGPHAGSTVALTPASGAPEQVKAPVRLIAPGGGEVSLDYGPNWIGTARIDVTEHVTVRAEGGGDVRVGGRPLIGACRLSPDDLLTIDAAPWTVRSDSRLAPPLGAGWTGEHRPRPPLAPHGDVAQLRLPTPPPATRTPRFPALSASVPLLMGLALWWATGSLLAAGFMGMSVVFVVASAVEARRDARAEDRERVAEFRADLADAVGSLRAQALVQRSRHAADGLSRSELLDLSRGGPGACERLWERSALVGLPSLRVRVGTGRRLLTGRPELPDTGRRDLRAELEATVTDLCEVDDVVTVDLRETSGIVIEGPDEPAAAVARAVLLQLCALIAPEHLAVESQIAYDRQDAWSFLRWLPHHGTSPRRSRLVVVDGTEPDGLDDHPDQIVIWVTPPGGPRPSDVTAVLHVGDEVGSLWVADEAVGDAGPVALEPISVDDAVPLSRRMCPLVLASSTLVGRYAEDGSPEQLPRSVALAEVAASPSMIIDPQVVLDHWKLTPDEHLAAPVGVDRLGAVVNLDLVADGPHALIAGTTGAGKSELLRTFLVAMALHHPPEQVNFLLIDYKGGAAFGPLGALPHTVGTITDLSGAMADRALKSLRAELRRREEIVADARLDRWTGAALLVVVDELATLVTERPSFVEGLVDLAQRGRSLGVHLVLATQRPAGVVTDSIRANVTMRICLRVADEDDSRDIVEVGSAAHLPRDVPGRALVRLGAERAAPMQVAHCGPVRSERPPVSVALADSGDSRSGDVADTGRSGLDEPRPNEPRPNEPRPNELELAVATIVEAAAIGGCPPVHRPWLDPLPAVLAATTEDMAPAGSLVIGLVDRPDLQCQTPLSVDLDGDGGVLVVGASGSGATSSVRALAVAAHDHPHDHWHVHVVDAGGCSDALRSIPVVGDVVAVQDVERVRRLLRSTLAEIDRRVAARAALVAGALPGGAGMHRRMLVIDGMAAFEHHHGGIDRGIAMDQLARIAREGRRVGVHLVVTAQRRAEIPMELVGLAGTRILLRCTSADEASLWGLDDSAATQTSMPPGRCRVRGSEAQITWHSSTHDSSGYSVRAGGAQAVPRCPTSVDRADVAAVGDGRWALPLGLDADELVPVTMDLAHHHAIVAGPPHSGVSTVLALLVGAVDGAVLVRSDDPTVLGYAVDAAIARSSGGRPALLVVDEASFALEGPDCDEFASHLERAVTASRGLDLRLVIGGEVDSLSRSYHDVISRIRRGRTGVMLGGDPDVHGVLWHATLRPSSDLPAAPGRGWLLGPGTASRVQVALP